MIFCAYVFMRVCFVSLLAQAAGRRSSLHKKGDKHASTKHARGSRRGFNTKVDLGILSEPLVGEQYVCEYVGKRHWAVKGYHGEEM